MAPPEVCPNCGADVPPKARACPECGADEHTGWSERAAAERLGLPDEFPHNYGLQEEFGQDRAASRPPVGWFWWAVAIGLLIVIAIYFLRF